MDLQTTYYIIGIIFMVLSILILLGIAILIFYIRKKVDQTYEFIETRINDLTRLSLTPVKRATDIAKTFLPQHKGRTKNNH